MDKRVFIERARHTGVRRVDRKRNLILDQKVVNRGVSVRIHPWGALAARQGIAGSPRPPVGPRGSGRPRDAGRPHGGGRAVDDLRSGRRRGSAPNKNAGSLGGYLLSRRRTLLWVSLSLIVLASFIPLYINLQSFMWEKRWSVENDREPLYDIFLDRSRSGFTERGENSAAGSGPGGVSISPPEGKGGPELEAARGFNAGSYHPLPSLRVREYAVRPGDSLFGIAAKFGVPVDGIISASNLKNARYIHPGMILRVPSIKGIMYKVKKGDNLSSIAVRYGARVNDIADINDLSNETIRPGQELFVPGASLSEWERAIAFGSFFKSPARGRLTSKVGFRIDPFTGKMAYHAGIDISGRVGTPVRAAQYGRVSFTGYHGGYGETVIIVHPDGYRTLYAHLDRIYVRKGQAVKLDEKIGSIGNTGRSTGPHLHFEIHRYNKIVDPLKVMKTR
jgi:murein DD-endopeptidase MepM/ murein hydrolase activator NlpD